MVIDLREKIRKIILNFFLKQINIFILSLIINIVLFALFFCFITPHFQTNDDNMMMEIASGTLTGQPSAYLIYINIIIGKLLVFLYSFLPNINWYPILFYFIHFISMIVIFYSLFSRKKKYIHYICLHINIFSF